MDECVECRILKLPRTRLASSLRSPLNVGNGTTGAQKREEIIHLAVAQTSDPSSRLHLGLRVRVCSQTRHAELGKLTLH